MTNAPAPCIGDKKAGCGIALRQLQYDTTTAACRLCGLCGKADHTALTTQCLLAKLIRSDLPSITCTHACAKHTQLTQARTTSLLKLVRL